MHRARVSILSSTLLLLAGLGFGSDAAAKPGSNSPKPSELIEIELIEYEGGKPVADSRKLSVPIHGEISGWLELFGQSRLCRSKSSPTRDELFVLELECRIDGRAGGSVFELRLERGFVVDEPTLLGEIETREGQRLRVVATRR